MQATASLYMRARRMCRHGCSKTKRPGAPPPAGKSLQTKQSGRQAAQHARNYLKTHTHSKGTARSQQQAFPGRGKVLPTLSLQARRCRVAPHVITGHAPAQCRSTANKLPSNTQTQQQHHTYQQLGVGCPAAPMSTHLTSHGRVKCILPLLPLAALLLLRYALLLLRYV
jgi:hypothetical protein